MPLAFPWGQWPRNSSASPPIRSETRAQLVLITILSLAARWDTVDLRSTSDVGIGVHRLDQQSVAQVLDLGIQRVRYTLYWSLWQDPEYRREWEAGIDRALRAGLRPLIVVHQAPFGGWAQREAVYRAFADFMGERAAQFPGVRAWQLWNEMDVTFTDVFGAGRSDTPLRKRGRLYAEMLRLAYPAIKQANPDALVVTGGIASAVEGGFLAGLYDGHAQYDVLAIHTYGFPLVDAFESRGRAARQIMQSHRDTRPLWNTEFGIESAAVPSAASLTAAQIDAVHKDSWRGSIERNSRDRVYERIYGHVLSEGRDLGFDLVRRDGSERPAYQWLKSWTRQR